VRHVGQAIPEPVLTAKYRWLSPHADGDWLPAADVAHCVSLCLAHPTWRMSIQQHKLWKVR
jgi:hypothetical protein